MLNKRVGLLIHFPYPETLSSGGKYILTITLNIRDPHHLGRREVVLEFINFDEPIIGLPQIQRNDVDLVVHSVNIIARHSHVKLVILPIPERYRIVLEVALVRVYLLCLSILG